MKIYFAHAMPTYKKKVEQVQKTAIKKLFPKHTLVDPGSIQDNPQKRIEGMPYCLRLVATCDALIFSKYRGEITVGVGKEVNHALENGLDVYELVNGRARKVKASVEHLSMDDTLRLYYG